MKYPRSTTHICHFIAFALLVVGPLSALSTPVHAGVLAAPPNNLGLIGYWSFDDGSGTSATDFSGNGNTGTLEASMTNDDWVNGKRGSALDFEGTDDFVSVGNVGSGVQTISFWIKADDITTREVINIDGTDYIQINASSQIEATSFPATNTIYVDGSSASQTITTGWHHVLITNTTGVTASSFQIGKGPSTFFDGKLDEVRLYNRVLSATEIQSVYNAGAFRVGVSPRLGEVTGLTGWWTLDGDDVTDAVYDRSGSGNNGSWIGGSSGGSTPPFNDDFEDGEVEVEWNEDDPTTSCTVTESGGDLSMALDDIASERDFYEGDQGACKLYQDLAEDPGSFTLTLEVTGPDPRVELDTVLGIYAGDGNAYATGEWLAFEYFDYGTRQMIRIYNDGTTDTSDFEEPIELTVPYCMRIIRTVNTGGTDDDVWETQYSDDCSSYSTATEIANISVDFQVLEIGVFTGTFTSNPAITATFESFTGTGFNSQGGGGGGTATSTAKTIGRIGQAMNFDGTDDYVDVGNAGSGIKTISFWLKAASTTDRGIMNIDGTDEIITNTSADIVATSFPGSTTIYVDGSSSSQTITTGWHHVLITDTTGVSASTLEIGKGVTNFFDGKIDDVRLYNRVLTSGEIKRIYNATRPSPVNISRNNELTSGLVGLWSFDGLDVTDAVYDRSGQGNNGYWISSSGGGASTPPFNDDFEDASIDVEWTEYDPDGACSQTESGGGLNFQISDTSETHDLYGAEQDGCVLYQDLSSDPGDFAITLELNAPTGADEVYGIHVGNNLDPNASPTQGSYVRLDYFGSTPSAFCNASNAGSATNDQSGATSVTGTVFLRLTRDTSTSPDTWTCEYSDDGSTWNGVDASPTFTFDLTVDRVGVWLGNFGTNPAWTGTFNDFSGDVFNEGGGGGGGAGTATSTAKTIGKIGQALTFDGDSDYVDVGNAGSGIKTISFWLKAASTTDRGIMNIDGTDEIITNTSADIVATSFPGSTTIYVDGSSSSQTITTGWHHVLITDTTGVSASTLEIGKGVTNFFDGKIDDVRLYNRVLTSADIKRLYNMGR